MDGRPFEVRSNLWASSYSLVADDGSLVATANRVGRKECTVEAGTAYPHVPAGVRVATRGGATSVGQRVGSIKRTSVWGGDAVADLPGLPAPVAVFALAVVLTSWDLAASANLTRRPVRGTNEGMYLENLVIDAVDPQRLGRFWEAVLGGRAADRRA